MLLKVKVISKASCDSLVQVGDALKIKITAAPEKGKANQRVIKLIAEHFGVAKSQIEIISGLTSHQKLVKINRE